MIRLSIDKGSWFVKMDPRRPQFCVERQIIGAAAAKLKGKGLGKKGLGAKVRQKVLKKVPSGMRQEKRAREENDEGKAVAVSPLLLPPPKKKMPLCRSRLIYRNSAIFYKSTALCCTGQPIYTFTSTITSSLKIALQ